MQELTDSKAVVDDASELRSRLAEDGYLYFRELIPAGRVAGVRASITSVLRDCLWLVEGSEPDELLASECAVGEGAQGFHGTYTAIQMLQEFHEFAVQPTLLDLAAGVLGEPVFSHAMHICRISPPVDQAVSTPPHQDYRLIQGNADTLTTWIPLADSPPEVGGLRVLHGSHRDGVLPVEHTDAPGNVTATLDDDDPRWRTTSFTAGDVLLFTALTAHGAMPNVSKRFRLSADFRYQAVSTPIANRAAVYKPHYYPKVPDWPTLTRGWTSTRSVEVPAGLEVVERFDPLAEIPTPRSRFRSERVIPSV